MKNIVLQTEALHQIELWQWAQQTTSFSKRFAARVCISVHPQLPFLWETLGRGMATSATSPWPRVPSLIPFSSSGGGLWECRTPPNGTAPRREPGACEPKQCLLGTRSALAVCVRARSKAASSQLPTWVPSHMPAADKGFPEAPAGESCWPTSCRVPCAEARALASPVPAPALIKGPGLPHWEVPLTRGWDGPHFLSHLLFWLLICNKRLALMGCNLQIIFNSELQIKHYKTSKVNAPLKFG